MNLILDTLLMSAVIHPDEEWHSLEDIAQRFEVQALGRHTAIGDAIVTVEIFLRMILCLRNRRFTRFNMRKAAEQTYFARLEY